MQIKININGKYNPTKESMTELLDSLLETVTEQINEGEVNVRIKY